MFIRRQANRVAHGLDLVSRSHASPALFDVMPGCIATILLNDA